MVKFLIYILSAFFVCFSIQSVDINKIFKKNDVFRARLFYFILILCLTYLLANFIYDFAYIKLF